MPALGAGNLDEASLQTRVEEQKLFVARLVSEGKDASGANAILYELCKTLSDIRSKAVAPSSAQ